MISKNRGFLYLRHFDIGALLISVLKKLLKMAQNRDKCLRACPRARGKCKSDSQNVVTTHNYM